MLDLATSYNPHRENHQRNCSKIRRHGVKTERFYINYTLPYLINIHPMNPKNIQNLNKIPYPFSYLTLPLKLGRGEERRVCNQFHKGELLLPPRVFLQDTLCVKPLENLIFSRGTSLPLLLDTIEIRCFLLLRLSWLIDWIHSILLFRSRHQLEIVAILASSCLCIFTS